MGPSYSYPSRGSSPNPVVTTADEGGRLKVLVPVLAPSASGEETDHRPLAAAPATHFAHVASDASS